MEVVSLSRYVIDVAQFSFIFNSWFLSSRKRNVVCKLQFFFEKSVYDFFFMNFSWTLQGLACNFYIWTLYIIILWFKLALNK